MAIYILAPDPNGNCCGCNGRPSPCDTCGGVTGCGCFLYFPPSTDGYLSRYATYSFAQSNLTSSAVDCYVYGLNAGSSSTTASFNMPDYVDISCSRTTSLTYWAFEAGLSISTDLTTISLTLNASFSLNQISQRIAIYQCTTMPVNPAGTYMTLVDESTTITSSPQTFTLPAGGTYTIFFSADGNGANPTMNCRVGAVGSGQVKVVNPAIAYWNDSGTDRPLEACPKMQIPPLTESSGSWYADETTAQSKINNQTSNCVGFVDSLNFTSWSATDGGASLAFDMNGFSSDPYNIASMWGSINIIAGSTTSVAYSIVPDMGGYGGVMNVRLYDYEGTLIQTKTAFTGTDPNDTASGTLVFDPVGYTGRYIVKVECTGYEPNEVAFEATWTSSGTMSVNQVQALYDVGVDCPARSDC